MKEVKFGWLFVLVCSFMMLYGCAPIIDLSNKSILGQGGLRETRKVELAKKEAKESLTEKERQDALDKDFSDTMQACNKVFTGFERTATNLRWVSFGIAMAGTIAGSIVVPALTAANAAAFKVAIAAFGGLSGAANSAQSVLGQQGLTAEETIRVREQLRTEFRTALNEYFDAKKKDDLDGEKTALQKAAVACISYTIQSTSAKVVTTPGPTTPESKINWLGPINVQLIDNDFRISSPEIRADADKQFFQFFTDNEAKKFLVQMRQSDSKASLNWTPQPTSFP